ncbi:MAG: toll/interleukin-1 receptor domain-containing protein [bacterium]
MPQVFLSYCHENKAAVKQLYDDLVNRGYEVFWDRHIPCGRYWRLEIRKAMENCFAVVACFSEQLEKRGKSWVWDELRTAIEEYRDGNYHTCGV